mmetsp:Transcript_5641/g.11849  ORF Transcript_5641/g.11849 Transcript_5641/m.11849 type:complete len:379 (+) Transcript_5641:962-2098(+)
MVGVVDHRRDDGARVEFDRVRGPGARTHDVGRAAAQLRHKGLGDVATSGGFVLGDIGAKLDGVVRFVAAGEMDAPDPLVADEIRRVLDVAAEELHDILLHEGSERRVQVRQQVVIHGVQFAHHRPPLTKHDMRHVARHHTRLVARPEHEPRPRLPVVLRGIGHGGRPVLEPQLRAVAAEHHVQVHPPRKHRHLVPPVAGVEPDRERPASPAPQCLRQLLQVPPDGGPQRQILADARLVRSLPCDGGRGHDRGDGGRRRRAPSGEIPAILQRHFRERRGPLDRPQGDRVAPVPVGRRHGGGGRRGLGGGHVLLYSGASVPLRGVRAAASEEEGQTGDRRSRDGAERPVERVHVIMCCPIRGVSVRLRGGAQSVANGKIQ